MTGKKRKQQAAEQEAGKKQRKRQQEEAAGEGRLHSHKKRHSHHHHHHHGRVQGKGGKDDRPHFGDLTGPKEKDVWESDDSDKVCVCVCASASVYLGLACRVFCNGTKTVKCQQGWTHMPRGYICATCQRCVSPTTSSVPGTLCHPPQQSSGVSGSAAPVTHCKFCDSPPPSVAPSCTPCPAAHAAPQVGYSSGSESDDAEPRHSVDASEHHTYEVGDMQDCRRDTQAQGQSGVQ